MRFSLNGLLLGHHNIMECQNVESNSIRCVRSMMGFVSMPIFIWRYALESTCYILNNIWSKSVNKISHEMWIGCKPVFSHLRVWGYSIYIKHLKTDKLGPRFNKYLFTGYLKETKGYYFYLADEQKIFVNNRIVFLKKKFLREGTNATKVELAEV